MNKTKIAICLTGQVRGYNQYSELMHSGLQETFKDWADYDVVGHTWEVQPEIKDPENFVRLCRTDQNLIWDSTVTTDPFTPIVMTKSIVDSAKYKAMFIDGTDMHIRQWMKEITIGIYSQIVSSWECFNRLEGDTEYDAYIKFRWDMNMNPSPYKSKVKRQLQHFIDSTHNSPAVLLLPRILPDNGSEVSIMQDTMIIFNSSAYKKMMHNCIHKQIWDMGHLGLLTDHTHGLWEHYLNFLELDIKFMTENTDGFVQFDCNGAGDQTLKWNKQWGL